MKRLFVFPAIALVLSLAACGGSENKNTSTTTEETTSSAESATTETVPGIENVELSNTIVVESNDQMKFDKELLRVKAGEAVSLTLKNVGTLPKESMGHNLIVLKPGVDIATFAGEATAAADADYIPKTSLSSIAAHTKLLGPGEEDKISFTLEKGVYTFICSFPGHYGVMQGKIVAE
ncbi:plastocyanin/azurin family copper-binding protein [Sphingobacterium deserti]|uniref:Blue (Type 1) copper domain protein n=1 Tax=Sphingobacterium deserti TaxID=1229276 RepID=A0A0B8T2P2_9SPHI|nr:azurin [Sphingobacterium deserti]KGE15216.1 blue (type 1) copper domain protein [Sphingobacterium deserti]